jgi:hypothetical protein
LGGVLGNFWYLHCAIGFMDYSYHFNALRDYLKLKPRYSDKPIDSFIQVIMIVLGRWDRYSKLFDINQKNF